MNILRSTLFLFVLMLCVSAAAAVYRMPQLGNDIVGHIFAIKIKKGDTISRIRRKYEISYHELLEANHNIKPRRLRIGQTIIIPAQYILPRYRKGIVINTTELRLYYFTPDNHYVFTTPVGLGRSGWRTPTTIAKVIRKEADPTWHVPESIADHAYETSGKILPEEIPPGPGNPLGKYAIYLSHHGYLIHGTNSPNSVGKYFSSGCMRLSADAIKMLFENVAIGTPVHLIHHANKAGWLNGTLYLESHMPVSHNETRSHLNYQDAENAIRQVTSAQAAKIDWHTVSDIVKQKTGIPQPIGTKLHHVNYGIRM